MERAGNEDMSDDVERKGLGTPATRADIIEKLVKDGFVKREKKQMLPTALTTIRETAFDECAMLKELNLSNVTTIEGYAFRNCTQLTKVILAKNLESIPVEAFSSCTSLADVTWPQSLKTISYYAFYEAPIATLQLPETVTSIGDKAFSNNKAITRFVFPKHVGK